MLARRLALGSTGLAELLVTRTMLKWAALRRDPRGFIEKLTIAIPIKTRSEPS